MLQRNTVVAATALSLWPVSTWLLNVTAYAGFNAVFPPVRDIATAGGALATMAWAFVAMRRPRILASDRFLRVTLVSVVLSNILMLASVPTGSAPVITAVALFHAAACAPVSAYLGLAFIHAAAGESLKGVALACLLRYAWMGLLWFLPMGVKMAAFVAAPVPVLLLTQRLLGGFLDQIADAGVPADLAVTNPFSFLPLTHRL